jgi:hypothetical protein
MKAMRVTECSDCGDYYSCDHVKTNGGFSETCPLPDVPEFPSWDSPQAWADLCVAFVERLRKP